VADLRRANSPQDESAVADLRRKWSTIPKNRALSISQSAVTLHRVAAFCFACSRLFEIARVVVRLDDVARVIINANYGPA
jgi:hypothetical protein